MKNKLKLAKSFIFIMNKESGKYLIFKDNK